MTTTEARRTANQINAQSSTGPRTAEGKAASRANALKHGLTGEGVVFLSEQTEAINLRVARLQTELQPVTVMGEVLVHRIGVLSVRLDSCQEREIEVVQNRIAQALRDFDENQLDQVDDLFKQLPDDPASCLRKLERTEPGLRKLLQAWTNLKSDLLDGFWKFAHGRLLSYLKGFKPDDCFALRLIDLTEAAQGRSDSESARSELSTLIDAGIASMNHRLATLDPIELAQARASVIAQARLDAAPAVHQIQKYEASTERSMIRMLKEARLVESATTLADQAKTPRDRAQAANASTKTPSGELASFSRIVTPPPEPVAEAEEIGDSPFTEEQQLEIESYFGRSNVTIEEILEETQKIQARTAALSATMS